MSLASTPRRASSFVSRVMIDWSSGWIVVGAGTDFDGLPRAVAAAPVLADLTYSGAAPLAPAAQAVKAEVELPDTFSMGGSYQVNSQWRVLADYSWAGWSSIQSLDIQSASTGARVTGVELSSRTAGGSASVPNIS